MKLSEFIQDTLYEIALGIHVGQLKAGEYVAIKPSLLNGEPVGEKSYIDFDLSLVVTEVEQRDHGAKAGVSGEIKVASVARVGAEFGGKRESSSTAKAEQTHRVSFKVPVYFAASFKENAAFRAEAEALEAKRKTD